MNACKLRHAQSKRRKQRSSHRTTIIINASICKTKPLIMHSYKYASVLRLFFHFILLLLWAFAIDLFDCVLNTLIQNAANTFFVLANFSLSVALSLLKQQHSLSFTVPVDRFYLLIVEKNRKIGQIIINFHLQIISIPWNFTDMLWVRVHFIISQNLTLHTSTTHIIIWMWLFHFKRNNWWLCS